LVLPRQYPQDRETKKKTKMSEQERKVFLASGALISVAQAAAYTPYSPEYLSLLARKGRIKAVKIGRDWLTTRAAVSLYLKEQQAKHRRKLAHLEEAARRML
jgi:excisionase family DNA binding protein